MFLQYVSLKTRDPNQTKVYDIHVYHFFLYSIY